MGPDCLSYSDLHLGAFCIPNVFHDSHLCQRCIASSSVRVFSAADLPQHVAQAADPCTRAPTGGVVCEVDPASPVSVADMGPRATCRKADAV